MTAKKRSFSLVLILVADLADPSSTLACHQRTVFLRKEFTKLRLLPLPADKSVHDDSVPKNKLFLLAPFQHLVVFVPALTNISGTKATFRQ